MQVLRRCAEAAIAAPSIFNTQPWRWQVAEPVLRLWADRERQLLVADPDGRMLTISCGVALHHARTAIAAAGYKAIVDRLGDVDDPDLLAEIRVAGRYEPSPAEVRLNDAIAQRRTDRRAFKNEAVPATALTALRDAAESQGAHLHLVRRDQVFTLALAATQAGSLQMADPGYRKELIRWTHRPVWSGDGVPVATAVEPSFRAVPVREFTVNGERGMDAGPDTDQGALYAVIFTDQDEPIDWLRAGEALSAVLLTATSLGLATAPMSDVTELSVTREQLRHVLSGIGLPQLAVRIGHAPAGSPPSAPRRVRDEVIYP